MVKAKRQHRNQSRRRVYAVQNRKQARGASKVREDPSPYLFEATYPTVVEPLSIGRYTRNGHKEKLLGAVYTPPRVASVLVRWAVRSARDRVLDPSCGEGVFLAAARTRLSDLGAGAPECVGVDIDPATAAQTGSLCADFFSWCGKAPKFDVIVGNPPFIRSHLFPEPSRGLAARGMERLNLHFSRLMSTWAPFLGLSCGLLKPNGRLAMVIPEELLAVGYAEQLREYLLTRFNRVTVCFPGANVFPEVQQAVVLLLCENSEAPPYGLFTLDFRSLEQGDHARLAPAPPWSWTTKWSHLFLSPTERECVNATWARLDWLPLREYGRTEVGVVTGDNDFFVLRADRAQHISQDYLTPVVTSARDLKGIVFDAKDFEHVLGEGRPAFLLNLPAGPGGFGPNEQAYLALGEQRKVPLKYKCRTRDPWYTVPSIWLPHAIMLRQAGDMPRLVHLSKGCTATDTVHRVTWVRPSLGRRLTVGFMNTVTMLAAELTGRSYGGGVLELMPKEANRLPLPEPVTALDSLFEKVDAAVRRKQNWSALDLCDAQVLPAWVSKRERGLLRSTLLSLVDRRKNRTARSA